MKPDAHAALLQLRDHLKAVRIDLSALRAGGADRVVIDQARWELYWVWRMASGQVSQGES